MRLAGQLVFVLLLAAALWRGAELGYVERLAALPPSVRSSWQQGLWPVHDRVAARTDAWAESTGAARAGAPLRVAVLADTSAVPGHRFAPLSADDLGWALVRPGVVPVRIEIVPADTPVRPDLLVTLVLKSYVPGDREDALTGFVRYESATGDREEEPFRLSCPADGRSWFVRPARRLPVWMLVAAGAVMLLSAVVGGVAASQTLAGRFNREQLMNLGAGLFLATFVAVLLLDLVPPGRGRFGIPRWRVRVALDTSDAVRFPLADTATPVDGVAGTNDVCRFVGLCVDRIAEAVDPTGGGGETGFPAWLRRLWTGFGRNRIASGLLRTSEALQIVHALPLARPEPPETVGAPAERVTLADMPTLLQAGHRGQQPGFFLPWEGVETNGESLVVAFMTGEPASLRQGRWLDAERASLRARRPARLQVLSVVLPSQPRSDDPAWATGACLSNVVAVSDVVLVSQERPTTDAPTMPGAASVETVPVFPSAAAPDRDVDLDVRRDERLRASPELMDAAARRVAERVRGLSDLRESSVFRWPPLALPLALVAVAGLLLFLRLKHEIHVLDREAPVGNAEGLGGLLGLLLAAGIALPLCYACSEPTRWRTLCGPDTVLWGVLLLWYVSAWLPILVGRCLGTLPAPERSIETRSVAVWFALLVALTPLAMGAAYVLPRCIDSSAPVCRFGGVACAALGAVLSVAFAVSYLAACFFRRTRRRTWCLAVLGLLLLLASPAVSLFDLGPRTPWVHATLFAAAVLLPAAGALSARLHWGGRDARTVLSLGWSGLVYGVLIGALVPLALLWPRPLGLPRSEANVGYVVEPATAQVNR